MEITRIERELRELWQHMAAPREQGEQPITRACVFNLIVYAPGRQSETTVNRVMTEVTVENPGRIFVLLPGAEKGSSGLNAWVTAQCHLASGGRKQVCCEQIMIRAAGESVRHLPSVVAPLLIPDIPVFVWWRSAVSENTELLHSLLQSADRLILNSSGSEGDEMKDSLEVIRQIHDLIRTYSDRVAVSDMQWAKMTSMRDAIARFYDNPMCRSFLSEITRIEIRCAPQALSGALLFVGWLGSRLKWRWIDGPADFHAITFHSAGREVHVTVTPSEREGPLNVRLSARGKEQVEFTVTSAGSGGHLISEMNAPGACQSRDVIRMAAESEALLLNGELSILYRDHVYEESVRFLLQPDPRKKRGSKKKFGRKG